MKRILLRKLKGQGDLLCSLYSLLAIIIVLFLSVYITNDISNVTYIDQVARQGIIKLETTKIGIPGTLDAIKVSLSEQGIEFSGTRTINGVTVSDGVYVAYMDSGAWKIDTTNSHDFNYGDDIAIYIQCEINTTKFENMKITRNNKKQVVRLKSSVTKAAS